MFKPLLRAAALVAALLWPPGAVAQNAVQQVGPVTAAHPAVWWQNGQVVDSDSIPAWMSGFLDQTFGSTPGAVLCRDTAAWMASTPPLSVAQFLQGNPAGCPTWGSPSPGGQGQIVDTASTNVLIGVTYTVRTNDVAATLTLPGLTGVLEGQYLEVQDGDNNASANNITLRTSGSDAIQYYGTSGTSFIINLSSTGVRVTRSNGAWRVLAP